MRSGIGFRGGISTIEFDGRLASALQIVLGAGRAFSAWDAADSVSYPGSGIPVSDVSGVGNHWRRGNENTWSPPPFNGSAGALSASEYFVLGNFTLTGSSAGRGLQLDVTTPAAINDMHKAGASFSIMFAVWTPNADTAGSIFRTRPFNSGRGIQLILGMLPSVSRKYLQLAIFTSAATILTSQTRLTGNDMISYAAWNILGATFVSGGTSFFFANGQYLPVDYVNGVISLADTYPMTLASPDTGSAPGPVRWFQGGTNLGGGMMAGAQSLSQPSEGAAANARPRGGFGVLLTPALTKAEMDGIYALMAPRYGLS